MGWDCLRHLRPLSVARLPPLCPLTWRRRRYSGGGGGGGGPLEFKQQSSSSSSVVLHDLEQLPPMMTSQQQSSTASAFLSSGGGGGGGGGGAGGGYGQHRFSDGGARAGGRGSGATPLPSLPGGNANASIIAIIFLSPNLRRRFISRRLQQASGKRLTLLCCWRRQRWLSMH